MVRGTVIWNESLATAAGSVSVAVSADHQAVDPVPRLPVTEGCGVAADACSAAVASPAEAMATTTMTATLAENARLVLPTDRFTRIATPIHLVMPGPTDGGCPRAPALT